MNKVFYLPKFQEPASKLPENNYSSEYPIKTNWIKKSSKEDIILDNKDIKQAVEDSFKINKWENNTNWYINPRNFRQALFKTSIQLIDPTGISGWTDLNRAIDYYKINPNKENAINLAWNIIGALPLLGKVKFIKLTKGITAADKTYKTLSGINKTIDTIPELIPGVRKITEWTQNITSYPFQKLLPKQETIRKGYNIAIDGINTVNSIGDIVGNLNENNTNRN